MARTQSKKKPAASASPASAGKTRKKRVGNVRGLLLKALASGAKTRPALQKASSASYNALVMHLSKLRDEGIVETDASNRLISLVAGKTATAEAAPAAAKAKPVPKTPAATTLPALARETALVAGYSPRVLNEALDALAARFEPVPALDEKLLVLDQLATRIGGPISHVLGSIKSDLMRFSTT